MTAGFRNASGVDFDSLFDPYVQGTPPAATGLRLSSGVDLAGRYAPIAFGTKGPDVGFRTPAGLDVSNLWAAFGTAHYSIPGVQGSRYSVACVASAVGGQQGAHAGLSLGFANDGTYSFVVTAQTSGGGAASIVGLPASGTWLPNGWAVGDTEIQFAYTATTTQSSPASVTNPAPTYTSMNSSQYFTAGAGCGAGTANSHGSSLAMTVLLKQVSTGTVLTTTFTAEVDAAAGV